MDELIPLELADRGQWAEVVEVCGDAAWVRRLAEMGIRTGTRLQVCQPGSPCLVLVGAAKLSVRGDLGLQILVRPVQVAA